MKARQPLGMLEFERADLNLFEIANERQQPEMFAALHARAHDRGHPAVVARQELVRQHGSGRGPNTGDVRAVHHTRHRAGVRIEQGDDREMVGQTAFQIAVEHVHDLHADLHPRLPRRHRERKAVVRDGDLRARRTLHLAAGERAEGRFQRAKEIGGVKGSRDLRFTQRHDGRRSLADFECRPVGIVGQRHAVLRRRSSLL